MAELAPMKVWTNRAIFMGLCFVIIVMQLAPLDLRPAVWAPPDILLAVTMVWVARRPDYLPVLVVAFVFLMADMFFQRPPGLYAALVVLLTEATRRRSRGLRNVSFMLEWGSIAFGIAAITLANRVVLVALVIPQPPLGLTLIQMISTILIYPFVVLIAHVLFGVSRPAPGETDGRGKRL